MIIERDIELKEYLSKFKIKLFCIQGNHEERPENIKNYKEVDMFGGKVFIEEKYACADSLASLHSV